MRKLPVHSNDSGKTHRPAENANLLHQARTLRSSKTTVYIHLATLPATILVANQRTSAIKPPVVESEKEVEEVEVEEDENDDDEIFIDPIPIQLLQIDLENDNVIEINMAEDCTLLPNTF